MTGQPTSSPHQRRVDERAALVKLALHFRQEEGLSNAEIARRLQLSASTVKAYFYDPDGSKARRRKDGYRGTCEGCGAPTSSPDGKGRAKRLCNTCKGAAGRRWTPEIILAALRDYDERFGKRPTAMDLDPYWAARGKGEQLQRLRAGDWPSVWVVRKHFGSVANALSKAFAKEP